MTEPTDALALLREIYAELEQGAIPNNDDPWWQRAAACIAKWGQPAQAAEPVGCIEIEGSLGGVSVTVSAAPAAFLLSPGMHKLFTAPQPTQAQAGAVPLTGREIELIDGMIQVQLDHASRCDAIANRSMADKQKGWDMERVAILQKIKAHGIKGGQQ